MNGELPQAWAESTVGECFLEVRNGTTATQNTDVKGLPVSRIETIQNSQFDLNRIRYLEGLSAEAIENFRYRPGDIALSHINSYEHVGKTALYDGKPETFIHGMNLLRLRLGHDQIAPRFAYLFMQTRFFREEVRQRVGHAVNQVSINQNNLAEVPFVVAPLAEQRRIVAKLEKLLGQVDACRQRLDKIPTLLKRFRQSVLAAACSGKLTEDWREENPQTESTSETLQAHAQRTAGRERNTRRMKPARGLTLLDYSEEFPATWAWLKVRELVERGAILDVQDGNHGELYPRAEDFGESGMPYISAEHVINDRVQIVSAPRLKYEKAQQLRIGFAKANDVILTHNATVGRVAMLPLDSPDVVLSTSTTYYRVDEAVLLARYLATFLRSHYFQSQLEAVMEQTTRNQVSVTKQVEFGVGLPPLNEQQEIVRRVESLFALADNIEQRYKKAQAFVDKLTPSLLAKAFRGELVPQDPNDEPASVLLERIKAEREKGKPQSRKKR